MPNLFDDATYFLYKETLFSDCTDNFTISFIRLTTEKNEKKQLLCCRVNK